MEIVAKAIVVTMAAGALICFIYAGMRIASDPILYVLWHNRLNGDPRDYPPELKNQWWARLNAMHYDPDLVKESPSLLLQYRIFGIVVAVISGVFLLILVALALGLTSI